MELNDVERVRAGLLANFQHDGRRAVQPREGARFFEAVHDMADIADANGRAADVADDDALEIARIDDASHRAQRQLASALVHASARDFDVLRGQRGTHLLDIQVVGVQLLAIEPDLNLALPIADEADLADAAERLDVLLDLVVDDLRGFAKIARRGDGNVQNRRRVGCDLLDHRRIGILRQVPAGCD